jgi:hypothetical protein
MANQGVMTMSTSTTEAKRAVATRRWVVDPSRSTASSVDTGNRQRDRHLRGTDFFYVEQHPHVRFTSARVPDLGNGKLWVDGELEAAGERVPVSFEDPATRSATTSSSRRRRLSTSACSG